MKNILLMGFAVTTMCCAQMSHANFSFYSSDVNACSYISGKWAGTGKASNWLIGECNYHGTGTISTPDNSGHFTINVSSDKDSGNFICPQHAEKQITGVCSNGTITLATEYGNLIGDFSEMTGSAQGTLTVSPGLDVNINIQFQRDQLS